MEDGGRRGNKSTGRNLHSMFFDRIVAEMAKGLASAKRMDGGVQPRGRGKGAVIRSGEELKCDATHPVPRYPVSSFAIIFHGIHHLGY